MTQPLTVDTISNRRLLTGVRLACLAACLIMFIISLTVYHADLSGLAVFVLFILFYVQLPGQFLLRLAGIRPAHFSVLLCTGLFTGWAFITLQYFVTELIRTNLLLYAAGPVCSLIYLFRLYKERKSGELNRFPVSFGKLSAAFCIFFTVGLFYSMVETQFQYLSPMVDEFTYMNPDKGFHIGLINSLSHGYPLECPWFSGLYFNYHIFTELLYSIPVRLFSLTADKVLLSCGPYMTVYTFSVSMYALFREMCAKADRAGLYSLALLMSNIFIARNPSTSLAFLFIYRNENVAAYGVSGAIALLLLIRYWHADAAGGNLSVRKLLPVIGVLMLVTGIKGPFGLVMLASMWGTFVLGLILRKMKFRMVLPLILMSAGFLLVYMTVLGSKGQGSGGESLFALATIVNITFFKSPVVALTKAIGLPLMLRYAVLLGVFTVFLLTAFFLPFVCGYIRELFLVFTGRREFDFTRVLVYAACLVGYITLMVLSYHGHSQVYFGFVTVFFAPLISFWFFEDMEENRGIAMKLIRGIFIACLILCCAGLAYHLEGLISSAKYAADPSSDAKLYQSMSQDEYKAMRWIDENTPKDSLIATDRYYSRALDKYEVENRWDNRFFLYADYSNRICYLAGSGYNLPAGDWPKRQERININNRLYNASDKGRGKLARSLGIDYVVVSKRFTNASGLENRDYSLCFSNKDVEIYEITD